MSDPFRERRYHAKDVRRILRRAATLAEDDPATPSVERSLTRDELERSLAELGLPASAIARASSDGGPDEEDDARAAEASPRSAFLGAPTRIVLESEVPGEPSEADREDIVEDIRDVVGESGAIETLGRTMIWNLNPGSRGQGRNVSVRLRSRNGRTRIVVEERLRGPAVGLFVGLGVGGGIGPLGAYIVALKILGVVGLVVPLVWIPLMLLLARAIFQGLAARRERDLAKLMRRLERHAASWSSTDDGAKQRVAGDTKKRIDAASAPGADDEAAAEDEAEAAAPARARRA